MELFLIRFLCGATLLLAAGLLGAILLQRRGPAASCVALRAALAGLVLCGIAAMLPAPVRPITAIVPPEAAVIAPRKESQSQVIDAAVIQITPEKSANTLAPTAPVVSAEPTVKSLPWQGMVLGIWAIGVLIGFGRLLSGHFMLLRLRRNSQPIDLGTSYPVELRESAVISTPLLAGCARAVLYLPQSGLLRESQEALQMALAHERAHHQRRDLAWSLVTQLMRTLLWFHPLIHLVAQRQELLAEQASDEAALTQLSNRQNYARLLLTLAELPAPRYPTPTMSMAAGKSRIGKRIKHLLSAPLSLPLSIRGRTGIGVTTLGVLVLGTAWIGYAQRPTASEKAERAFRSMIRRQVTLSVKDRPLKEVIDEVAHQSLYPITVDPNLTGNITLSMKREDCKEVLKAICAQIQPAAWVAPMRMSGTTGYTLLPLPAVGMFSGQVLGPGGKPVANTRVWCQPVPNSSGSEIPLVLRHGDEVTTDAQGRFIFPRAGKWSYEVMPLPEYESGLIQTKIRASGVPGKTISLAPIKLVRGAHIEVQFPDYATLNRIRPETPAQYPDHRKKPIGELTMVLLVPPGESRLVAEKEIASYKVRSFTGAGKWQLKNGVLSIQLKSGETARLVVDAELTAAEKQKRQREQKAYEKERNQQQRQMATVKLPSTPTSFQDAVQDLCKQAGQAEVVIEPGISGTVTPRQLGFFEHILKDLCAQATPVAFPLWEGGTLHIVRAPERGQFDEKTYLYRLLGTPNEVVYLEKRGSDGSGGDGNTGVSYRDAPAEEVANVAIVDPMSEKPMAGVTVVHETHGNVRKVQTDARGQSGCSLL